MKVLKILILIILIIASINWGLVGLFNFDIISFLFGNESIFSKILYIFIGFIGLTGFILFSDFK